MFLDMLIIFAFIRVFVKAHRATYRTDNEGWTAFLQYFLFVVAVSVSLKTAAASKDFELGRGVWEWASSR